MEEGRLNYLERMFEETQHHSKYTKDCSGDFVLVADIIRHLLQSCSEFQNCDQDEVKKVLWEKFSERSIIDKRTYLCILHENGAGMSSTGSDSGLVDTLEGDGYPCSQMDIQADLYLRKDEQNDYSGLPIQQVYPLVSEVTISSEDSQNDVVQKLMELKLKYKKLSEENLGLKRQLLCAEDTNEVLTNANDNLKKNFLNIPNSSEHVNIMQDEVDCLKNENENLLCDISKMTKKCEELTSESSYLRSELRCSQNQLEVLQADYERVEETARELKTTLTQCQVKLSTNVHLKQQREKELSNAKITTDSLTVILKETEDKNSDLYSQNSKLTCELSKVKLILSKVWSKIHPGSVMVEPGTDCRNTTELLLEDLLPLDENLILATLTGQEQSINVEVSNYFNAQVSNVSDQQIGDQLAGESFEANPLKSLDGGSGDHNECSSFSTPEHNSSNEYLGSSSSLKDNVFVKQDKNISRKCLECGDADEHSVFSEQENNIHKKRFSHHIEPSTAPCLKNSKCERDSYFCSTPMTDGNRAKALSKKTYLKFRPTLCDLSEISQDSQVDETEATNINSSSDNRIALHWSLREKCYQVQKQLAKFALPLVNRITIQSKKAVVIIGQELNNNAVLHKLMFVLLGMFVIFVILKLVLSDFSIISSKSHLCQLRHWDGAPI